MNEYIGCGHSVVIDGENITFYEGERAKKIFKAHHISGLVWTDPVENYLG